MLLELVGIIALLGFLHLTCGVSGQLDPTEVEVLFKNVQSGSHFDLRASAQPSAEALSQTEGTIVVSLGCKYKDFCAALCRTFILNGRKVRGRSDLNKPNHCVDQRIPATDAVLHIYA